MFNNMFGMFDMFYVFIFLIPLIIIILVIVIIVFFINRNNNRNNNNMDQNQIKPKASVKDIFFNLGAFIALYTLVGNLLNLLFNIIDKAYPKVLEGYNYGSSASISWPVSILVVLFPVFILLMYLLEREYRVEPDRQNSMIHRGFAYITLVISGLVVIGDLITVIYYFIDGQELTTGFLMKILVLLIIASGLFLYFISDLRGKLTASSRVYWRFIAGGIVIVSIVWGFAVLGSPRTQRLYKYDEQKVYDLRNLDSQVTSYYSNKRFLPLNIGEVFSGDYYVPNKVDSQNGKEYEYKKNSDTTYELCAEFNKASDDKDNLKSNTSPSYYGYESSSWTHGSGRYCFSKTINPRDYYNYSEPVQVQIKNN